MNEADGSAEKTFSRPERILRGGTWTIFILSVLLVLASVVAYYPVHNFPFTDVDDNLYVYENPSILKPLNLAAVQLAFTHSYVDNYVPIDFLFHSLAVQIFRLNPGSLHEVNVVLHAMDALLLFWVLSQATGFIFRIFVVAALFVVHPINVENVAWIAEQKTMLSTLFFLLALGTYRWYARVPRLSRMMFVMFWYVCGLLAKPQVIILPCVLLLWDYWPLRRMLAPENSLAGDTSRDAIPPQTLFFLVKEKIPLFAVAALDSVITLFTERGLTEVQYTFPVRVGNAVLSYGHYLLTAIWPVHLAFLYLHPGFGLPWICVWGALGLLLAISAYVVSNREQRYLR